DFAAAVARVGKFLGYHVTVCDARKVFATASRFPDADEVVVDWPHRFLAATEVDARTVICVLTHDPKFDVPLLEVALRTPAGYIGAMGSRRTHDDRLARLREVGLTEDELARLRSPIGLDLRARTPLVDPDHTGFDQVEAVEETLDPGQGTDVQLRRSLAVDAGHAADDVVGILLGRTGGAVADGQVAARRHVVAVLGDDPVR